MRQDFCAPDEHDGAVHRCLHSIMALIEDHAERAGIPPRFAASKLAEGDQLVLDRLDLDQNEKDALEHIICQMEPNAASTARRPSPTCGSASSARVRANGGEADRESRARAQHAHPTSC